MSDFERILEAKINELISPYIKELNKLKSLVANQNQKEYLSAKEVRDVYGISRSTLERLSTKGKVTKHYMGSKTLYKAQELQNLIHS